MRISVVVPTIGRESLERTLESLQNQTYSADEIIVEQDFDQAGPAITRNNGARRAHGDLILFIDDDCVAAPNWIERMRTAFENPAIIAASGAVLYRGNKDDIRERAVQNPDARWFMGANCGVRRNTFWKLGGFPEKYLVYEDKAFALACWERGYFVARVPLAHVYHEVSLWNQQMVKRFSKNLACWVNLSRDYNIWADKNNPPPIWGGFFLMPRDYPSFFKHLFKSMDEFHWLRAKLLFKQRINLWKHAIKNKKLLI